MIQQNCYNKPGGFKYSSQDPKITFLSLSVHRNIPERRISIFTCKLMAQNISVSYPITQQADFFLKKNQVLQYVTNAPEGPTN